MTQHIENLRTMPVKCSPAIIERILKLVKPEPDQAGQCKLDVVTAAHMIMHMHDYVSPTVERRQLLNVVAKLQAAEAAINALPQYTGLIAINALPPSYGLRDDAAVIADIAKRAARMAAEITKRRSTGSPKKHFVARQKQIAAEQAYALLKGRKLTQASDGVLNRVAGLLLELGTGKPSAERAVEKACARVLRAGLI